MAIEQRLTSLEIKYESLEKMISFIDEYSRHTSGQLLALLGFGLTLIGAAGIYLVKNMINEKLNKEVDKRLEYVLKNNPPVFHASGEQLPDAQNKIFLPASIRGLDQLEEEEVLVFEVRPEFNTMDNLESGFGLTASILKNEEGSAQIVVHSYTPGNGKVYWKLLWPRKDYII